MYILDTNVLIAVMKEDRKVIAHISRLPEQAEIFTTIINAAELYYGAYKSQRIQANLEKIKQLLADLTVLELGMREVETFGEIKSILERNGEIVPDNDLFIASIALRKDAILVTNNTRHFLRVEGLTLEDWSI